MSMHLEGPWLSTTGRRKSKRRFRTAEAAAQARANAAAWQEMLDRYGVRPAKRGERIETVRLPTALPPVRRETPVIPSRDSGMGQATAAPSKVYTGEAMLGVATMHKSNSVPVFRAEDAVEISKMRRN